MKIQLLAGIAACWMAGQAAAQEQGGLFEALRNGDTARLRTAITSGTDVNIRDADGNTLLIQAATYATAADLDFLLAHRADVNAANQAGHTALMRSMPDLAKVKLLVEHGAGINASADGATPLLIAAGIPGAEPVLRYLLEKGADLKAVNPLGFDAAMIAALSGAAGNLKILLEAGASSEYETKGRRVAARPGTIFDAAAIERIGRRAEGVTALIEAARGGCGACVRLLLDRGADAKARSNAGMSALHFAAFKGDVVMVKALLEAGAPVNIADDRGLTPLIMAANSRGKDPAVVRLLLEHGADSQAKDSFGRTAGDWAQIGGRPEIIAMLPAAPPVEVPKPSGERAFQDIRAAVQKSIALLEETAPKFFPKTGCTSCHNGSIPLIALAEARRRGYSVKPSSTELLVKQTVASFRPERERILSGVCGLIGRAPTGTYGLMSLHGASYAPGALTDAIAHCIAIAQSPDGHWFSGLDTRPPLSAESSIPDTATSARVLKLYAPPAQARDTEDRVARARAYLLAARPWSGDDYAYRLLGLTWTGAGPEQIRSAATDLVNQQRPDGGWAQHRDMSSDAYETGLALWALASAEPSAVDAAVYRLGVDYLMRTQEKDGSWHVRSRAFGFQPYFESGFPHGHDQWISMAATAWSAMALMPAAEHEQRSRSSESREPKEDK
jgi:ankyrin repeat protein